MSTARCATLQHAALLLCFALPAMAHDWLIVPGQRVGPVTAASTPAGLIAAFGGASVKPAQIRLDAKTTAPGVEIYPGKPGESLAVIWPRNDRGLWWPLQIIPCYGQPTPACRWQTAEGVHSGMRIADLQKLNGKPFRLFPDLDSKIWTSVSWDSGKLAQSLGQDVELQFELRVEPEATGQGYFASTDQPLTGLPISRMSIYLLSPQPKLREIDWTIGGRLWTAIETRQAELLRENLGAVHVRKMVAQGDEGIGEFPEIAVFEDQPDRSVITSQNGPLICGASEEGYRNCRWRLPKPFTLIMPLQQMQALNGRPFVFNGFDWDFGGVINSWEGGKLEQRWPNARAHYVICKPGYPERMMGEGHEVRSDDPALRKLGCSVLYR